MLGSDPRIVPVEHVAGFLTTNHYLGAASRGIAWSDRYGVLVVANPSSRRLPQLAWMELTRWCLTGEKNAGSRQFSDFRAWLFLAFPEVTTLVSYSDPAQGHTGALYRACNWLWAPTWHRLRPPPSGNGDWGSGKQAVKDRWIFPMRPDPCRADILSMKDDAVLSAFPESRWIEPKFHGLRFSRGGADFKTWRAKASASS